MEVDIPDSCVEGDHEYDQTGRCTECGIDRVDTYPTERRTGGAGARVQPCTDREYSRQMRKLERISQ